ncbi:hypothetical protein [Vibrio sp. LaRot3]|uniref:hypothetical protein n=1 Tax=Vibrio sp. LaRot3 TaxID=2998829 RepID=UPI0022CDDD05|nr:hypothetical protein [Vibrio sp. LaRot3]MDA0147102.1 hypothetical protein [Vibrio sp. LaRot3]
MKKLIIAAGFVSLAFNVMAEPNSIQTEPQFLYQELVGGPYFDDWSVAGDIDNNRDLVLYRAGKSGELQAPVKMDCQSGRLTASGNGLLFAYESITAQATEQYFSQEMTQALYELVCN